MTIARKLALLVLFALFGMGVMTAWFLVSERKLILEERQTGVRQVVEVAHGIAVHFHTLSTKGAMPDEEARQRAAAAMQALRYSGNEYIWINDMHPRMVMHPVRPELNGQDLSANKERPQRPAAVHGICAHREDPRRRFCTLHVAQGWQRYSGGEDLLRQRL